MTLRTRFAPSPTGPLHLGHAYSAFFASDLATADHGTFLLRIEDIDRARSRSHWEEQIFEDLQWLGLTWPQPVMRQSHRLKKYADAIGRLKSMNLLYPCTCNRRDIETAASAPQEGAPPRFGPDGMIYPGTCRARRFADIGATPHAIRLDIAKALKSLSDQNLLPLMFFEKAHDVSNPVVLSEHDMVQNVGDIVLARRDMGTSYHLSVVVDDAAQGITDVVRGADLFDATQIHVLLQALLGYRVPHYHHHRLVRDKNGKRLAKRDYARAIAKFRADGCTPSDIRKMLGLDP
ncbi:MAG: tRNA glutamyl-Q(34) synthetase GluQRS [Pseudomonadota bacterium]